MKHFKQMLSKINKLHISALAANQKAATQKAFHCSIVIKIKDSAAVKGSAFYCLAIKSFSDAITVKGKAYIGMAASTKAVRFLRETVNPRVKSSTRKVLNSPATRFFKDTVAVRGKQSGQSAFDISKKYVTLSQAQAQAGIHSTRKVIIAGGQQLPGTLKRRFLAGLRAILPIGITILILVWMFNNIDGVLQPLIRYVFGRPIPGAGFGFIVLLIIIAGIVVGTVAGRRLIRYGEGLLSKLPLISYLYNATKQIIESFSPREKGGFMEVVLVEFPKKGMRTVGFVTNEAIDQSGKRILNVLIPTAPNPTSGFLQIMTEDEVIRTDISVEDALKMVVSAGRLSATEITEKLSNRLRDSREYEGLEQDIQTKDKTPERI